MKRVAICGLFLASSVAWIACASPAEHAASDQVSIPLATESTAERLPGLGKGFLIWESNRTGRWRLWIRDLAGGEPTQLTPDEGRRLHCCPHISPDGRQIAYLSLPPDQDGYPRGGAVGTLMMIQPDGSQPRSIADEARNYYENRAAVWKSRSEIIYIRRDGRTALLDVETGTSSSLTQNASETGPWLINNNLTWAASGQGAFSPFDRDRQQVADRGPRPGCQPYFTHDGIWGFWVVAPGGPINRLHLESGADSSILKKSDRRLPADRGYLYFPMLSSDGRLLAFAASNDEHEHFKADYEVFVVETDPATLELVGEPIQFTHHEATDRFPDVFLEPLPLGRRYGEAPFSWASPPFDHGENEWQWSYGDGTTAEGPTGDHLYTEPGRYEIVARMGDTTLRGQVVVTAATPPTILSSTLHRNGEEIVTVFDESVDISGMGAALESDTPIAAVELDRDYRRLRLTVIEALSTPDILVLTGITDRAQSPNSMEPVRQVIEMPMWPATRDGLTLLWETGDATNLLYDSALEAETAVTMTPRGRARLDSSFAMLPSGGHFEASQGASSRVISASKKTYEISIEMTIEPFVPQQQGSAVILTSASRSRRNFSLEQHGSKLVFTLRMKSRGEQAVARVPLVDLPTGHPTHILVTYSPGSLRAFHEGELVISDSSIEGGFFHWRPAPLVFGSDWNDKRAWRGRLEGVAIYSRALEDEEAHESFLRYRSKLGNRPVKSTWRVRATRTACSAAPTLAQIDPYREALTVCHYQVHRTLVGEDLPARIRVARWSMLDGQQLRLDTPENRPTKLDLSLYGDNPQLESIYLSDTLESPGEGPLFFLDSP